MYLTPDSPAEEWYTDTGSQISAWANFKAEFKSRFSGVQKVKKTAAELKREMLELVLKTDDLDKMESYGGVEVETYKVHVKKLFELTKHAKIDTGTANIVHVQDKLLEILKDKVGESHANWKVFHMAIETVDRTYIRDEVRKHRECVAQIDSLSTQITRVERMLAHSNNPISDLTTQLSRTTISSTHVAPPTPLPQQFPQQPNPACQTGSHLLSVTTEDEKTIVQVNIHTIPALLKDAHCTLSNYAPGKQYTAKTHPSLYTHHLLRFSLFGLLIHLFYLILVSYRLLSHQVDRWTSNTYLPIALYLLSPIYYW